MSAIFKNALSLTFIKLKLVLPKAELQEDMQLHARTHKHTLIHQRNDVVSAAIVEVTSPKCFKNHFA